MGYLWFLDIMSGILTEIAPADRVGEHLLEGN
jgi:hypothetical protein